MSRRRALALAPLVALLAALGAPGVALAHARSTSTSSWELEPGPAPAARVLVRVQWSDLQRTLPALAGVPPALLDARSDLRGLVEGYLTERVALLSGTEPCPRAGPVVAVPSADPTHVSRAWVVRCERPGDAVLRVALFLEALPSHLHLARVTLPDGGVIERVFVLDQTELALEEPAAAAAPPRRAGSGFADYVTLGVEHIATGWDHMVFLLALLLMGVSVAEVATVVTGFTLAHSLTLALGVLGVVEPLPAAIEALIGLSIAVVALENFALTSGPDTRRAIAIALAIGLAVAVLGALAGRLVVPPTALVGTGLFAVSHLRLLDHVARPVRLRWFVAFVFGLLHGFGFAGVLTQIGLPAHRLAPALLGFNVGVELGQLAVVAAVWPLLRWALARSGPRRGALVQAGSTPVLAAGLFWFVSRSLA